MYKNMHIMRVSYDPDGLKKWNSYATASSLGHFEGPAKNEKVDTVTRYNVVLRSRSCCRSKNGLTCMNTTKAHRRWCSTWRFKDGRERAVHGRQSTTNKVTYEARESGQRHLDLLHLHHILLHYTNHATSIFFHNTPILLD